MFSFIMENLEYYVAAFGGIVTIYILMGKKAKTSSNDLSQLVIQYNKQRNALNKQSKGVL